MSTSGKKSMACPKVVSSAHPLPLVPIIPFHITVIYSGSVPVPM